MDQYRQSKELKDFLLKLRFDFESLEKKMTLYECKSGWQSLKFTVLILSLESSFTKLLQSHFPKALRMQVLKFQICE